MEVLFIKVKQYSALILLVMICFLTIASVNAIDLNESSLNEFDDLNTHDLISIEDNETDNALLSTNFTPKTSVEIQNSIENANDGDTIILDGYYSLESKINVNKALTFIGQNNATVDGLFKTKLFYVSKSGVTFKNITFINADASNDNGGAISSYGGVTVDVINCSFINNTAKNGGALAYCTAINCSFLNNSAEMGGATYASKSFNSSFTNNFAINYGGAMSGGRAENSKFKGNSVNSLFLGAGGGAVTQTTVFNCTFIDNIALSGFGSAMWKGKAENSTFINNTGSYALYQSEALNSIFSNNSKGAMNGGSAVNCWFINNNVESGYVMFGGSANNCSFVNNSANSGGAMYSGDAVDCWFVNNSANFGGAMSGGSAVGCWFVNNSASEYGGAVSFEGYDSYSGTIYMAYIDNCTFINNSADDGGAISAHISEYYYYSENSKKLIQIINSIFVNNTAYNNGGAVEISHRYRIFNVTSCIFINNSAQNGRGSEIYTLKEGNIDNTSFINCSSNQAYVIWTESNINITASNFTNCSSNDGENYLGYTDSSLYNITECIFEVIPSDISYHYFSRLTVNDLYIAKGEKGILYANLSNICGPIVNKRVNFAFNGKKYYAITNSEGIAEFNVNNYLSALGETFIELSYDGDELNYQSVSNSTVYINNYFGNLTVGLDGHFYNDTILTFKLVNSKTNVPISNARIKLNFTNGRIINLTTDFDGYAIYTIPFAPDTYEVFANVDEDYVDVNNVSVKNIVIKKLIGDVKIIPINDNHTLMIKLIDPDDSSAMYRNVKINLDVGPSPIVQEELFTNEEGYVLYDLLNFTKGTYSVSASVHGDYMDFYDDYINLVISNLLNSKINFTNNITFEFGDYGSTNFTVYGGTLEYGNIKVVDHPEAIIGLSNNVISVSYLSVGNYTLMVQTTPDDYHNAINATLNITVNNAKSKVSFSAGIVFEYGSSSSIHVIVDGGTVERKNIQIDGHPEAKINLTNQVITVSGLTVGSYVLRVTSTPDSDHTASTGTVTVTVKKATAVIKASKLTVALKRGTLWKIKLVDSKRNTPIANMKVTLKVYTGKKFKIVTLTTNSKGEASYQTNKLSKGNHKVIVSASDSRYNFNTLSSSIKVIKPKALKFKLKKRVNDKGGSLISYVVLDKKTKKGVNGVKINVLMYTGKKVKKITLKSKKIAKTEGAIGFATNDLSVGKHKVVIVPVSIKYTGSAKTTMIIKPSAKKIPSYLRKL